MSKALSTKDSRCVNCLFYKQFDRRSMKEDNGYAGICRRFPPAPVMKGGATVWSHAFVDATGWCGEFVSKHNLEQANE